MNRNNIFSTPSRCQGCSVSARIHFCDGSLNHIRNRHTKLFSLVLGLDHTPNTRTLQTARQTDRSQEREREREGESSKQRKKRETEIKSEIKRDRENVARGRSRDQGCVREKESVCDKMTTQRQEKDLSTQPFRMFCVLCLV